MTDWRARAACLHDDPALFFPTAASQEPGLGFTPGDHVCAFYSGSRNMLDDIVVDYVTQGLTGAARSSAWSTSRRPCRGKIRPQLVTRDGLLNVREADDAYMPDGRFSKDEFIGTMQAMVQADQRPG